MASLFDDDKQLQKSIALACWGVASLVGGAVLATDVVPMMRGAKPLTRRPQLLGALCLTLLFEGIAMCLNSFLLKATATTIDDSVWLFWMCITGAFYGIVSYYLWTTKAMTEQQHAILWASLITAGFCVGTITAVVDGPEDDPLAFGERVFALWFEPVFLSCIVNVCRLALKNAAQSKILYLLLFWCPLVWASHIYTMFCQLNSRRGYIEIDPVLEYQLEYVGRVITTLAMVAVVYVVRETAPHDCLVQEGTEQEQGPLLDAEAN